MANRQEEFLKRLQAAFTAEAAEHCQALSTGLLQLERAAEAEKRAVVEVLFRSAHSLKGAARAVSLPQVESICHRLETIFQSWRRDLSRIAPHAFDPLHRAIDVMRALVRFTPGAVPAPVEPSLELINALDALAGGDAAPRPPSASPEPQREPTRTSPPPAEAPVPPERAASTPRTDTGATVRVDTGKVERVLYAAEELLALKATLMQRSADLRGVLGLLDEWRRDWSDARGALRSARQPSPGGAADDEEQQRSKAILVELVDRADMLNHALAEKIAAVGRSVEHDRHASGKLIDNLLEETKELLLLPFSTELHFYTKLVRDLAADQRKDVEIVVRGSEVEIDKRILQELKDPLVHLLRNSVDHGIEPPDHRVRAGKPARGAITLVATQLDHRQIELVVRDDGRGIDVAAVREAAERRGIVTAQELTAMAPDDALALIFRTDVTTAPIITEVSGHGLGLAIVAERVETLGGKVQVRTEPNRGTEFRIVVPVAQTTFRGVLVAGAGQHFVLPAARVERVQRTARDEIKTVENRETVLVENRPTAFVWLADALELPRLAADTPAIVPIVIIGNAEHRVAFGVDAVLREEEVLVKPLRKPLSRVRNIAGATVLGSGEVVPILHAADLLKTASGVRAGHRAAAPAPGKGRPVQHSVLVAEDSITSRMLLKNILESAGYRVKTAVDGLDALAMLRSERFDLLISDVEMPRLNGFGLTAAVRGDRRLADLPVILVTALATREDRERGIDVGANAYLVKSDFDQSDLIAAVQRFL